ncbi:MAG: AraC family transcriptional regulator [Mariniphaga sp.]
MDSNTEFDKIIPHFDNNMKPNFKKYLPVSDLDLQWGLIINDLGHTVISKNTSYPSKGHPGTHMFSWDSGRILNEFHFVLITSGRGVFESKTAGKIVIDSGDGFMLFPGEWHRYKPSKETGWTESWIGFSGKIAEFVMKDTFFDRKKPVINSCANMLVQNLFNSLFQLISEEPFGYQRTASGVCLQLLAEICNIQKGWDINIQASSMVSKAKYLMHKKIDEKIDFHSFCKNHGISYSKFRSDFKHQTGFAPFQYFLLMKVEKAKDLLRNSDLKAKQIAFSLSFKSDHYFSRIFKMKTGLTPQQFRTKNRELAIS